MHTLEVIIFNKDLKDLQDLQDLHDKKKAVPQVAEQPLLFIKYKIY